MAGYGNRTDLIGQGKKKLPVSAGSAKGKKRGTVTAQREAQKAVPMGAAPDVASAPVAPRRQLPNVSPLSGPSDRPNEPITAGVDFGPGPSSAQAGIPIAQSASNDARENLIYLNNLYPNSDLADLISSLTPEG